MLVARYAPGDPIYLDMNLAESNHGGGNRRRRPREPVSIFPGWTRPVDLTADCGDSREHFARALPPALGQSVSLFLKSSPEGPALLLVLFLGARGFLAVLPFDLPEPAARSFRGCCL